MTPEDKKRLKDIESRANAATGNKWIVFNPYGDPKIQRQDREIHCMEVGNEGVRIASSMHADDAEFAAHAMEDIPWLLELICKEWGPNCPLCYNGEQKEEAGQSAKIGTVPERGRSAD